MNRPAQLAEARIGRSDRGTGWRAREPARRRFAAPSDAGADRRQGALWAKLLAERPDMLGHIVTLVQGARRQIAEPPAPRRPVSDEA